MTLRHEQQTTENHSPLNKHYLVTQPGFCYLSFMQKFNFLLPLLCLFLISCHGHRPVTTIETTNGSDFIKIRYSGTVSFTSDSSAIEGISPMGSLNYRNDKDLLQVNSNEKGQLSFEMKEDGKPLIMDKQGKEFIAKAVKVMIAQGVGASR
jgi:hypothetical protein